VVSISRAATPVAVTALAYAFLRGKKRLIELLLLQQLHGPFFHGTDCHSSPLLGLDRSIFDVNPTSLHMLARSESLAHLVESEARLFPQTVNYLGPYGWAPLHAAVSKCNVVAFSALLAQPSIDIDVETSVGRTPLFLAIQACWQSSSKEDRGTFRTMACEVSWPQDFLRP
jgi:hypothetical protein